MCLILVVTAVYFYNSKNITLLDAFPKPPQVMYGKVFLQNGSLLGSGYLIEARVGGIHYGQNVSNLGAYSMETRTHSVSSGFNYGITKNFQVCADNPTTQSAIEGAQSGQNIQFYIEGIKANVIRPGIDQSAQASIPFKSGTVVNADLILPTNTVSLGAVNVSSIQKINVCKDIWGTPTATPIGTATPTATPVPRLAATYVPTATPQGTNNQITQSSNSNGNISNSGSSSSSSSGGGGGGGGFVPPTSTPVPVKNVGNAALTGVISTKSSSLLPPTPTPTPVPTATPIPTATPELAEISRGTAIPIKFADPDPEDKPTEITTTPISTPEPTPTFTPTPISKSQNLISQVLDISSDDAADALEDEEASDIAIVMEGVDNAKAAEIVQEIDSIKAAAIVEKVESEKAAGIVENVISSRAAEIVEKVESKIAAEIVENVGSDKAAEIVSMVESIKAAEIVDEVGSSKAAEIMDKVNDQKAADIVEKIEVEKAANIVAMVATEKAAEIVKNVETIRAAEIVENVESSKAAEIVEKVESTRAAKIVSEVRSSKAAEIVEKVESLKAAEIVQEVSSSKAAEIVEKVNTSKAADIVGKIGSIKAAQIVQNVDSQKAAEIVQSVESAKAADIVKSVESNKAAEIVEKVETSAAASIVEKVESSKAAEIVERVGESKAAEIVNQVISSKASEIVERVETSKASKIVENVDSTKAAEIVENVKIEKTVQILTVVGDSKVGEILDSVTKNKVSEVVKGMNEKTLTQKLPEMTAAKMFDVSSKVLLNALPNVSSEQLVSEVAPVKDVRLPDPVQSVISENSVSYSVPVTVIRNWTQLVGSPKPIDEIMVRFNQELADVAIRIDTLQAPSHKLSATCEGFSTYSTFDASLDNAPVGSINTAHIKAYVEKEWMDTNNIHKWSITGNLFDEVSNSWVEIPSKRISEDKDKVFYTFSVPNLSEFAISGCAAIPINSFETKDMKFSLERSQTNQTLNIDAKVTNLTSKDGNYVAVLWINNSSELTKNIPVAAGASADINFQWHAEVGLHNIRVDRMQEEVLIKPLLMGQNDSGLPLTPILVYIGASLFSLLLGFSGLWIFILRKR